MVKNYTTKPSLVIVESPAKCKKIEEYLGAGYKVIASYGHFRELSSLQNIQLENNFKPTYTIMNCDIKKRQIENIKKSIENSYEVILASDSDREGEAIAWHICDLFKLDISNTKRIVFNEITQSAIQHAISNPRFIDMNLVYAQQARQILDLLVGFKISPLLWKFITSKATNSLSAGRCQSPALKLIYDNQKDIDNNEEKKIYNTVGYFTNMNIGFDLNKQYETEDQITDFLNGSADFAHIYTCSEPIKTIKEPPTPFSTSRLQQTVSNELHYSPKETMKICQTLYEAGYITYMRTDSKTYSKEFIENIKVYISRQYEDKYIHENIQRLITSEVGETEKEKDKDKDKERKTKKETKTKETKSKDKDNDKNKDKENKTQDAHEAIRPTNISLKELPETIGTRERRLYKLIWETTLESCMSNAIYHSITASISAYQNTTFRYTSELIHFAGWKIVKKNFSVENKEYYYLQTIKQNNVIPYIKFLSKSTFKNTKSHYTEAKLIQLLEDKGIGRPSTFSMLVDKIQERGYVKKQDIKGREVVCSDFELSNDEIFEIETKREFGNEKNKLVIQPLGIVVMEFLEKHFMDIFNYDYTQNMENNLDKVANGSMNWVQICDECNTQLDSIITALKHEKKIEFQLDEHNTYIIGKFGPVIKCTETVNNKETISFKPIKNDIDIQKLENNEYRVEDIVDNEHLNSQYVLGKYENKDLILRKGKYGLYVTWGKNSKSLKELEDRSMNMESITYEEVIPILESVNKNIIREISPSFSIRTGSKGDYIFYKTSKMKKPKFMDIKKFNTETNEHYRTCDISILKKWIIETYELS